jgi:hypothetical protein
MTENLSYQKVFESYEPGDYFYDGDLKRFTLVEKKWLPPVQVLCLKDDDGNISEVTNLSPGSNYIWKNLSNNWLKINKFLKTSYMWKIYSLHTKETGFDLLLLNEEHKEQKYEEHLKRGIEMGVITEEEYKELLNEFNKKT